MMRFPYFTTTFLSLCICEFTIVCFDNCISFLQMMGADRCVFALYASACFHSWFFVICAILSVLYTTWVFSFTPLYFFLAGSGGGVSKIKSGGRGGASVALGATRQADGFFWPKALAAARGPGLLVCLFSGCGCSRAQLLASFLQVKSSG